MSSAAIPAAALLTRQAAWLAAARARVLRRIAIAKRERVLDLGAGYGTVTPELVRRSRGAVVALDREIAALGEGTFNGALRVAGNAFRLPFRAGAFDLVFSQFTLLWLPPLRDVLQEIHRVLSPGGVLVALEPVYSGLIEFPPQIVTRDLWLAALPRAGADPDAGIHLPPLLADLGFDVHVALLETLESPASERFSFLAQLPLTPEEERGLRSRQRAAQQLSRPWSQIAHLPICVITAQRPSHETYSLLLPRLMVSSPPLSAGAL